MAELPTQLPRAETGPDTVNQAFGAVSSDRYVALIQQQAKAANQAIEEEDLARENAIIRDQDSLRAAQSGAIHSTLAPNRYRQQDPTNRAFTPPPRRHTGIRGK